MSVEVEHKVVCYYCSISLYESETINDKPPETIKIDERGKHICPTCDTKKAEIFIWLMTGNNFTKLKNLIK